MGRGYMSSRISVYIYRTKPKTWIYYSIHFFSRRIHIISRMSCAIPQPCRTRKISQLRVLSHKASQIYITEYFLLNTPNFHPLYPNKAFQPPAPILYTILYILGQESPHHGTGGQYGQSEFPLSCPSEVRQHGESPD